MTGIRNMRRYILIAFLVLLIGAIKAQNGLRFDLNGDLKENHEDTEYLCDILLGNVRAPSNINTDFAENEEFNIGDVERFALYINEVWDTNGGIDVGIGGWEDIDEDFGGVVSAPMRAMSIPEGVFEVIIPLDIHMTSFQLCVRIPDGCKFVKYPDTYTYFKYAGDRARDHLIKTSSVSADNTIMVAGYSTTLAEYNEGTDFVRFLIEPDVMGRDIEVTVYDVIGVSWVWDVNRASIEPIKVETAPTSVALDIVSSELKVGETLSLIATVTPDNRPDKTVAWSSSDTEVATVDEDGVVTAVGVGTTTITATCGPASAACEVNVSAAFILGDSNCDKVVNVTDAVNTLSYILGDQLSQFDHDAADVNSDGEINEADVTETLYLILQADYSSLK